MQTAPPGEHIERPSRRRDFIALGVSLALHLAVLAVFLWIVSTAMLESGATEAPANADIVLEQRQAAVVVPSAPPSIAPRPVPPVVAVPTVATPRPTATPRPIPRTAQAKPKPRARRAQRPPTPRPRVHRELSMLRPSAPPQPTNPPTEAPTPEPVRRPTVAPIVPTSAPTEAPPTRVAIETAAPTRPPTIAPTRPPTAVPTIAPTRPPTAVPTTAPTRPPTAAPTRPPTSEPTRAPTAEPTKPPTAAPTQPPTAVPTRLPTVAPTRAPTSAPTRPPTEAPAAVPSVAATSAPATAAPAGASPRATAAPRAPATAHAAESTGSAKAAAPRANAGAASGSRSGQRTGAAGSHAGASHAQPHPGQPVTPGVPAGENASPVPPSNGIDALNARLRALLPHGATDTAKSYGPATVDPRAAAADWEKRVAIPVEVLANTFGLIRTTRTLVRADSVTYVFERRRDLFGREVCRAFRVTAHPEPTVPPRFDPSKPVFPDRNPSIQPVAEYVDVRCDDPAMKPVAPGSLATPAPRP